MYEVKKRFLAPRAILIQKKEVMHIPKKQLLLLRCNFSLLRIDLLAQEKKRYLCPRKVIPDPKSVLFEA